MKKTHKTIQNKNIITKNNMQILSEPKSKRTLPHGIYIYVGDRWIPVHVFVMFLDVR